MGPRSTIKQAVITYDLIGEDGSGSGGISSPEPFLRAGKELPPATNQEMAMTATDLANGLDPEQLPIEYIPKLLRPIAQKTGAAAIFRLMREFGGLSIYVPETHCPDSRLLAVVGDKAFRSSAITSKVIVSTSPSFRRKRP
jgi:hypothetical protein